ncbi:MAG: pentapeptide repeat-containing protein [Cyanobacteria bacterium P01_H01_bin.153]
MPSYADLSHIHHILLAFALGVFALGTFVQFTEGDAVQVWGVSNRKHLAKLKEGIEVWNQWRKSTPEVEPNLTSANLCDAHLSHGNFRDTCLRAAALSYAYLDYADLSRADLSYARLNPTYLDQADLSHADLSHARLNGADFIGANLSNAELVNADLDGANFIGANLSGANLTETQVLNTKFQKATLTGACIADWQISNSTCFEDVRCEYIYRTYDSQAGAFTDRLPVDPKSTFQPGEFKQWIAVRQGALDTIDITFTEGIDWPAFFQSLQTVRQQYPDANVAMRAVEEKNGVFVTRLELQTEVTGEALDSLKASVETQLKASYGQQLAAAQGEIRALERTLDNAMEKLAMTSNQNFYGPIGNVASTNYGQMTATIHQNYGPQADDIIQHLAALRVSTQSLPEKEKETAQLHIKDLTNDVAAQSGKPGPIALRTRIVGLLTVAITLGTHVATATDFANNVLELSQKLDVPTQTLQPQLQQLKEMHPDFEWE